MMVSLTERGVFVKMLPFSAENAPGMQVLNDDLDRATKFSNQISFV